MRIFAVGDIHGCYDKLLELLGKMPCQSKDTIVFLGDYIDRGEDNKKVVEYLIKLKAGRSEGETIFLKGNHEKMFLDYLKGKRSEEFLQNGGGMTLKSYTVRDSIEIPDSHMKFFNNLRLYYETEDYIFVHAGLAPAVSLPYQREEDLLWIRGEFVFSGFRFGKKVIFGHTATKDFLPFFDTNKIGIDTGAVYGGYLTAIQLPEEKIYQV